MTNKKYLSHGYALNDNLHVVVLILLLVGIILTANVVRLVQLGVVPSGLTWDEAAVGYNGWSIWTIHRDEWLHVLPISFKSFGDFKAPLAIYMNGLSTLLFGLQPWAIRFPYALSGILCVILFFFSSLLLHRKGWWSLASVWYGTFIFAIIPWHIHFSRIGYESGVALFFILLSWLFMVIASYHKAFPQYLHRLDKHLVYSVISALFLSAALYTYHSVKLFVPALFIVGLLIFRSRIKSSICLLLIFIVTVLVCSLLLVWDSVFGQGAARASVLIDISIWHPYQFLMQVLSNIVAHLDLRYLLFGLTDTYRHGEGSFGILLPGVVILIGVGLISPLLLGKSHWKFSTSAKKFAYLVAAAWFIAGMLPGWLSKDVPHANRTLLALPSYIMFAMIGWDYIESIRISSHSQLRRWLKFVLVGLVVCDLLWFIAYQQHYYTTFAANSEGDFQTGYSEVFSYISSLNGTAQEPETIVFSRYYGQPYIYALLNGKVSAIAYHQGALVKYLFVDKTTIGDLNRKNALVVATTNDTINVPPDHIIYSPSGKPRFFLYRSKAIQ